MKTLILLLLVAFVGIIQAAPAAGVEVNLEICLDGAWKYATTLQKVFHVLKTVKLLSAEIKNNQLYDNVKNALVSAGFEPLVYKVVAIIDRLISSLNGNLNGVVGALTGGSNNGLLDGLTGKLNGGLIAGLGDVLKGGVNGEIVGQVGVGDLTGSLAGNLNLPFIGGGGY